MADDPQPTAAQHERRSSARIDCNLEGSLLLIHQNSFIPCTLVDLSLGGCRIRTESRFLAGPMVRVEVCFRGKGASLRLVGVTQWTDRNQAAGIRFIDMTPHRIGSLTEFIATLVQTPSKALEGKTSENSREAVVPARGVRPASTNLIHLAARETDGDSPTGTRARPSASKAEPDRDAERRASQRYAVDTGATVHLLNVASRIDGQIVDLSLGGCRIRTERPFPVGIFRRVETEFRVLGLPFRLGGVTQSLHDRTTVGIRFLDMSVRKREQLQQLIHEIEEYRAEERRLDSAAETSPGDEGEGG